MLNLMPTTPTVGASNNPPPPPFAPRRTAAQSEWQRPVVDVFSSIRRHWGVSLGAMLVLLGCGALVLWKKAKPVYEAHSIVYISPKFPKILATDTEVELPYDSYVQDQIQTVIRYDIIADAIAKLPYSVRHRTGPALPGEIQDLQKELEVYRIGSSYQMSVTLRGPSPAGLAGIVNAVTDTYVEKAKNEEFYGLDERLNTLNQEKDRIQKQIDQNMAEQAGLMQQLGVAMVPSPEHTGTNPYDSTLDKLRDQLASARMQRQAAEAELASFKGNAASGAANSDSAADDAAASDNSTAQMRNSLNTRRAALMEEMSGLRPDHPIYQKDKQELASIDSMMSDLKSKAGVRAEDKLKRAVAQTRMVELQLAQELNSNTHTATSAAPKYQRATELGPEIGSLQKAQDAINDRIRDLELESSSPGSIHMSTKALDPIGPEKNRGLIYAVALLIFSLGGALGAAVLMDLLDSRIYTPLDVEKVVGFHPLGVLLDDDEFQPEITGEYYFRLAAGIDHAVRSTGARTFLFTSPAHGSGTSSVVAKLSDKLRSLDLRTRVIVASMDEAAPAAEPIQRPELLLKDKNKMDEMQTSPIAPLAVPHVRKPQDSGSGSMARTVHHVGDQYDVVLIDASPLPISANTEYLARVADATVLVVKSSTTTRQELDRAARLLDRLEVSGVAVVLNKISHDRADSALKTELARYKQSFRSRYAGVSGTSV
jgi:succinoglycan biosynthesis transport protein ExoP